MKILVLNGPNMNLLGVREPEIYGKKTYAELVEMIGSHAKKLGIEAECVQTNHEGAMIDHIQSAYFDKLDGIVINPAGYTHTSVAIGDAIRAIPVPTVEVHISAVDEREDFRRVNFVRDACVKSYAGMGFDGYMAAIDYLYSIRREK